MLNVDEARGVCTYTWEKGVSLCICIASGFARVKFKYYPTGIYYRDKNILCVIYLYAKFHSMPFSSFYEKELQTYIHLHKLSFS